MTSVETKVSSAYSARALKSATPYLSVVIPTWNGGSQLSATLDHMLEFRARLDFQTEIVIVDDCSEPNTAQIANSFAQANELAVVLTNRTHRGKGHAVARGMLTATGRYRVFADSDLAYPS